MVVIKVRVVQQYDIVTIVASLNTMRVFVKKTKKCPMYIIPIDFN